MTGSVWNRKLVVCVLCCFSSSQKGYLVLVNSWKWHGNTSTCLLTCYFRWQVAFYTCTNSSRAQSCWAQLPQRTFLSFWWQKKIQITNAFNCTSKLFKWKKAFQTTHYKETVNMSWKQKNLIQAEDELLVSYESRKHKVPAIFLLLFSLVLRKHLATIHLLRIEECHRLQTYVSNE